MKPAHPARENFLPIEITRLELRRRFVAAVIENHGRPQALAAVAVNGGHIGPMHAVVLEVFVERCDAHGAHPFCNQMTDGIIHHRRSNAGLEAKTVGQIPRDIEFSPAHVDIAVRRFAKRNDPRVEAVDQGTE